MQKVKIYLEICGDYVSFGETDVHVLYDITNNLVVDIRNFETFDEIKEYYEKAISGKLDYCDVKIVDAIRTDEGEYFYNF